MLTEPLRSLRRVFDRSRSIRPSPPVAKEVRSAPRFRGYIDELSELHVHGWAHDVTAPEKRLSCVARLDETGEVLARGVADRFRHGLYADGVGDGAHAYYLRFPRKLTHDEQERLVITIEGGSALLPRAPQTARAFEPLLHVAMDIVDNCNLRCPFCLYNYAETRATHFMSPETIDSALRLLPLVRDGEFWFSCLHEPALHPELVGYVERVPPNLRRKLFFTSNIAKRMPQTYFEWLANNGMHHVNISIESRDSALYERMRKGARFRIFQENWDMLIASLRSAPRPTPIRYICMAYKSNLKEIPELISYLLDERCASQVEIRYTFDVPFISADFKSTEFLDDADWDWLDKALGGYGRREVLLLRPPASTQTMPTEEQAGPQPFQPSERDILRGKYMFRMSWDGSLRVVGIRADSRGDNAIETVLVETNIRDIDDPMTFLDELPLHAE